MFVYPRARTHVVPFRSTSSTGRRQRDGPSLRWSWIPSQRSERFQEKAYVGIHALAHDFTNFDDCHLDDPRKKKRFRSIRARLSTLLNSDSYLVEETNGGRRIDSNPMPTSRLHPFRSLDRIVRKDSYSIVSSSNPIFYIDIEMVFPNRIDASGCFVLPSERPKDKDTSIIFFVCVCVDLRFVTSFIRPRDDEKGSTVDPCVIPTERERKKKESICNPRFGTENIFRWDMDR